jgi:hypothetical protein
MEATQVKEQTQGQGNNFPLGEQPGFEKEKEKRENLFRELTSAKWSTGKTIGVIAAVLFGLGFLGAGGIGIVIGLALLALAGWLIYQRFFTSKELESTDIAVVRSEIATAAPALAKEKAVDVLRLDPEDVVQSVTLYGPAIRWRTEDELGTVEGRMRNFQGQIVRDPVNYWTPWAGKPDGFLSGRYQIHNVFALEDAIAYHTIQYDVIDAAFSNGFVDPNTTEWVSGYASNKFYYRKIENVRMTEEYLDLDMDSGKTHRFWLRIPRGTGDVAQNNRFRSAGNATTDIQMVDRAMIEEGMAFERAVNELRDEWERRAVPR